MKLDLLCFSHLRWNFVYQRPQHLLSRFSKSFRTFYIEEPLLTSEPDGYSISLNNDNVWVVVPHLNAQSDAPEFYERQATIVGKFLSDLNVNEYIAWYYTPMALKFTHHLSPRLTVYDCMDELSAFKFAPPELKLLEKQLLLKADLVFTGGHSIYEAKKSQHDNIHPFPSSIDKTHFSMARHVLTQPADQQAIPSPRFGFFGVLDERFDADLVKQVAQRKPNWQFILIGPVVKIDPATLPVLDNIHYLGAKEYKTLPHYLAGWDIAMMPFALNESTRFISPTKTPEYLAGGKPVVATAIRDVVKPYGINNLVNIVKNADEFIAAGEKELLNQNREAWLKEVDDFIKHDSWDITWQQMMQLINIALKNQQFKLSGNLLKKKPAFDYLVVGAGFAGAVVAERLATQLNKKVLVVEKRNHIAGNAYDYYDDAGILIHKYGPHIFHTNSAAVFEYLSQFTSWRPYEHEVLSSVDGRLVPIPINLNTINQLYNLNLNSRELELFLAQRAEKITSIKTSEDVVVSAVGRDLYEKFFRGYTRKMWDLDPSQLDASVAARVPTRTNCDNRYFTDTYQFMPAQGYTKMFEKMLAHPNIKIMLNTDYKEIIDMIPYKELVFTGPIDEYFDYCYGKLPYRSIDFKFETLDQQRFQSTGTINYPNDNDYTRITEFKYLTGQKHDKTSVVYEFSKADGDPYYPIPRSENASLYKKYQHLAEAIKNAHFTGRLATYKYYNMDQVVAQSLTLFKKLAQSGSVQSINELIPEHNSVEMDIKEIKKGAA